MRGDLLVLTRLDEREYHSSSGVSAALKTGREGRAGNERNGAAAAE